MLDTDTRSTLSRHLARALAHHDVRRPTHAKLHAIALVRDLLQLGILTGPDLVRAASLAGINLANNGSNA
jgi:hypothetical protein